MQISIGRCALRALQGFVFAIFAQTALAGSPGAPPEGASCVVTAGNRNAPLAPDGSYTVYGIPGNLGAIRARATCSDGTIGQSAAGFTNPFAEDVISLGPITWGTIDPVPVAVHLTAPDRYLSTGEAAQLSLQAIGIDGSSYDATPRSAGTTYAISNDLMATISEDGLVTIFPEFAEGSSARVVATATAEGSVSSTWMFVLGPRGTLSGRVLHADGLSPVANAQISVLRLQPMEHAGLALTDGNGEFTLEGVNAGRFVVSAIDPATGDRALANARIDTEGQTTNVELRLNGQGSVGVTVVDADGQAVPGAEVTLTALGAYRDVRNEVTDLNGHIAFDAVTAGDFTVSTRDPVTRLVGTAVDRLSVGQTLEITLRLQPIGQIQGVVYASDASTPIVGAQVRIISRERGMLTQVISGANGAFAFDTLPISDGPFTLDALIDGRLRARVPGVVISTPNQTIERDIVLNPVGRVEGQVRDGAGQVFPGSRVSLQTLEGLRLDFETTADADGRFAFPAVPVGDFELTATTAQGRNGRVAGRMEQESQTLTLDVVIATNTLEGVVHLRDGVTPVGAGVTVYLAPRALGPRYSYEGVNGVQVTQTDGSGRYGFHVLQANAYYVQAEDGPERGRAQATIVNLDPSQPLIADVTYLAKGRVSGTVRDPFGVAQANVPVSVRSEGAFTSEQSVLTDGGGHYSAEAVFAGEISVVATRQNGSLAGTNSGRIDAEGQHVTLDVTLAATGSVSGRVIERGGAVVSGPVRVSLRGQRGQIASLDLANGSAFEFPLVPLGDLELHAEVIESGDQGIATTRLTSAGESKVVDVRLVGQGEIQVQLRDVDGQPVEGARVTVSTRFPFPQQEELQSDAQGLAVFPAVFAGDYTISATKPAPVGALSGSASGTLLPSASDSVEIEMSALPIGRVRGVVLQPDGVTPAAAGLTVRMLPEPFRDAYVGTTDANGEFVFENVQGGSYNIDALSFYTPDACPDRGRIRGRATGVTVVSQDQEVETQIQLIGQGSVSGRVSLPNGEPAAGIQLRLTNPDPVYGLNVTCSGRTTYDVVTGADGRYSLPDVPPGDFTVLAENGNRTLRAEGFGRVRFDGDPVELDLELVDSAVSMPWTFHDANGFRFDILGNGAVGNGTNNVYTGTGPDSAGMRLEIFTDGVPVPFVNGDGSIGRLSPGGEQVEVDDQTASGLFVTRRIYTPRAGYFTRYLEVLRNDTGEAITVDLRVRSHHRPADANPRVVDSSDGDQVLSVIDPLNPDRWVVVDDQRDADPFGASSIPATVHLFDGEGGALRVASAVYELIGQTGRLGYRWNAITVEPGQTVALMHFTMNQMRRTNARAAAQRIAGLPPEAIDDLTTDERAAILNFVVPEQSLLAPLPNLDAGLLMGQVLSGDAISPVPGARVSFRSKHLLFARERVITSSADGSFEFRSTLDGTASNYVIPVFGFDLWASYPRTAAESATAPGDFPSGQTQTWQDLVFTGTGNVRGIVERHNGAQVDGAEVRLCRLSNRHACSDEQPNPTNYTVSGDGGRYLMLASRPRDYHLFASKDHPQRGRGSRMILGEAVVTVTAGDTAVVNITLEPTGSVSGIVRAPNGTPVKDALVQLFTTEGNVRRLARETISDTAGFYRFTDVPLGAMYLGAHDPISGARGGADAEVFVDIDTEQDIQLVGSAGLTVQVQYARGLPASGGTVYVQGYHGVVADSNGVARFALPVGSYDITVYHPDSDTAALRGYATAQITDPDSEVEITIALPPAGEVSGTIVRPDGTTLANGFPYTIEEITQSGAGIRSGRTTQTGAYRVKGLPVGEYMITAYDPGEDRFADAIFTIDADGQEVVVDLVLRPDRIDLPASLVDANRFTFDVQHAGSLASGSGAFQGHALSLRVNGQPFLGETSALLQAARRQFLITRELEGLQVTRKIYVPMGAYFARYIDVLENPGDQPLTVDLELDTAYAGGSVIASASGDTTIDANDGWYIIDDAADRDIRMVLGQMPVTAHVVGAASGDLPPSEVLVEEAPNGPRVVHRWLQIEIPPQSSVSLMHFMVQQINRAGAQAAVERLSALPPEVLLDLADADVASIANFTLPAELASVLEPLPSLTSSLDGIVYEGDARTPVRSARVTVQSTHPLFNRVWGMQRDPSIYCTMPGTALPELLSVSTLAPGIPDPPAVGSYSLQGQLNETASIPLPEGVPTVLTVQRPEPCFGYFSGHPTTQYPSRLYEIQPSIEQDVLFDTGVLTGSAVGAVDLQITGGRLYRSIDNPDYPDYRYQPIGADATWVYPGLPAGNYDLLFDSQHPDGVNAGGRIRGQRIAVQVTAGQITVVDVPLQPTGSLRGTVVTRNGEPSDGATVVIESTPEQQVYDQCAEGCVPETLDAHKGKRAVKLQVETDSQGNYAFAAVPAGTYSMTVTDPISGGRTVLSADIDADESAVQNVTLLRVGSIDLTVQSAAGAPVVDAYVYLRGDTIAQEQVVGRTDGLGLLTIANVPEGGYTVRVRDPRYPNATHLNRSVSGSIIDQGEIDTLSVSMLAQASLAIQVVDGDNAGAAVVGAQVWLTDSRGVNTLGNTDANGRVTTHAVPQGNYTVRARAQINSVIKDETLAGQVLVANDNQTLNAVIDLRSAQIPLPLSLFDANRSEYRVPAAVNGDELPTLRINGQAFTGATTGARQLGGRQYEIRQLQPMSELQVSRRVFVPRNGYFARYLEVLENLGAETRTVNVELDAGLPSWWSIETTSSGDATLDSLGADPDVWYVVYGGHASSPAWSMLAADPLASLPLPELILDPPGASGNLQARTRWSSVSIEPGQRVVLMHFVARQLDSAGAEASAQRLAQLPPEALDGLTSSDVADIANFVVPADGISTVEPLPALDGAVAGAVLEGDASTRVPFTRVSVRSSHPLFPRTWYHFDVVSLEADEQGEYGLVGALRDDRWSIAIPVGWDLQLSAQHPWTGLSTTSTASFAPGESVVVADVQFPSGSIEGQISGAYNHPFVSGGRVMIRASGSLIGEFPVGQDGRYRADGIGAGTYRVDAEFAVPLGSPLTGRAENIVVQVGQTAAGDLVLDPNGGISGEVRRTDGSAAADQEIRLKTVHGHQLRQTRTDASGAFGLYAVPAGNYQLEAVDSRNGAVVSAPVTVIANQTTSQDLTLLAQGMVTVHVTHPRGIAAQSAGITLTTAVPGASGFQGSTDATGSLEFAVPVGVFTLRAQHPITGQSVELQSEVIADGDTLTLDMVLPAMADLRVTVLDADNGNAPIAGARVNYRSVDGQSVSSNRSTDAQGQVVLAQLHERAYVITAHGPDGQQLSVMQTVTSAQDGTMIEREIALSVGSMRSGTLAFQQERRVFMLDLGAGELLSVAIAGLPTGGTNCQVRAQFYNPQRQLIAEGFGYLSSNGYVQVPETSVDLRTIPIDAAGRHYITVSNAGSGCPTADFRLGASVSGISVPIDDFAGGGSVTGLVIRPDGQPFGAGARVRINNTTNPGMRAETLTDESGRYLFPAVPRGNYQLTLSAPTDLGVVNQISSSIGAEGEADAFNLQMVARTTYDIQIRNADGSPMLRQVALNLQSSSVYQTSWTNSQGFLRYVYQGNSPLTITATHPDNSNLRVPRVVTPAHAQTVAVDIELTPAGLELTVTDPGGVPVQGVSVEIRSADRATFFASQSTGESGTAVFEGIPGNIAVSVEARDPRSEVVTRVEVQTVASQTIQQTLELRGRGTVSGVVRTLSGAPIPHARVDVNYPSGDRWDGAVYRGDYSDESGVFVFEDLPIGADLVFSASVAVGCGGSDSSLPDELTAKGEGGGCEYFYAEDVQLELAAHGETSQLELLIDVPGGRVEVAVFAADGDNIGRSCQIFLENLDTGETRDLWWECDDTGVFSALDDGNYRVESQDSDIPLGERSFEIVDGQAIEVVYTLSVVKGTLRHPDGNLVDQVGATLESASGGYLSSWGYEGAYRIIGARAGDFRLELRDGTSGLSTRLDGNLPTDESVVVIDAQLPPSASISGQVTRSDGSAVSHASVYAYNEVVNDSRYVVADADGQYTLEHLPLGTIYLGARQDGTFDAVRATISLESAGQIVVADLPFAQSGSISGQVLDAQGAPHPSACVQMRSAIDESAYTGLSSVESADAEGRYTFATLTPGPVTLRAFVCTGGDELGIGFADVVSGAAVTVDLQMGTAHRLDHRLVDPVSNYAFEIGSYGTLNAWLQPDSSNQPYYSAYSGRVGSFDLIGHDTAQHSMGGRQLQFGPVVRLGYQRVRKILVPEAGGYARILDSYTNLGSEPRAMDFSIGGDYWDVPSADSIPDASGLYAVQQAADATHPEAPGVAGHVYAGMGALLPDSVDIVGGVNHFGWRWARTVAPGETVSWLTYAVVREPQSRAAAQAQALALSAMTEPGMFDGLSAAERASVINFVVPQ